jgi:threonine-phosphate decarboxylase
MIKGHGGNIYDLAHRLGCLRSEIIDMSSNVNPLGPPPGLMDFLTENIAAVMALPEADAEEAVRAFAKRYNVCHECVLAGNGTTEIIYTIPRALGTRQACILGPTYSDYADACLMHGVPHEYLIADEALEFQHDIDRVRKQIRGADTVFICNPNNPTGVPIPSDDLAFLCKTHPDIRFVIDESYLPFVGNGYAETMLNCGLPNVLVLNSMSKIFRIPGLRIGFLIASEPLIEKFRHYSLPWNVNSLAHAAVIYLMTQEDENDAFIAATRTFLETERNRFAEMLGTASGFRLFPSQTDFILIRLLEKKADEVCAYLAQDKILIRNCANFTGLSDRFVRISLKTQEINDMLAEKMLRL